MFRRLILTLVFIALFLHQGRAQFEDALDNTYVNLSIYPNYYFNHGYGSMGVGVDLGFGKWLVRTVSIRGIMSMQYVQRSVEQGFIAYLHGDWTFDLITSIKGTNKSNFRSYLILGIGLAHTLSGDNDFCGVGGIGLDWQMGLNWRLYSEAGIMIHPSDFDKNSLSSFLPNAKIGIIRDIRQNPTRRRATYDTQQFGYDWYFLIGTGVSWQKYKGKGDLIQRIEETKPIVEFGMGKTISKIWGVRLTGSGFYLKNLKEMFTYYSIRGDMIIDIRGWLTPEEKTGLPMKPWTKSNILNLKPYFGASLVARMDDNAHFLFSAVAGGLLSYRFDTNNEVFIEGSYMLTPPRFARVGIKQDMFSVGLISVTVGYSLSITQRSY